MKSNIVSSSSDKMSGLKFDNEVYLTDKQIEDQLIASGIDMKALPLATLITLVRAHAPRINTSATCQIWVAPKGHKFYYENIYFAAKVRNRTLVNLFIGSGFQMSREQSQEVDSLLASY